MQRMAGDAMPFAMVDGKLVTLRDVAARYQAGDHIVNGGPEVGLFWADNIRASDPRYSLPVEHALRLVESVGAATRFSPGVRQEARVAAYAAAPGTYPSSPGIRELGVLPGGLGTSPQGAL